MNSIHRVGLVVAALVAILTIAGALIVQGYTSAQDAARASSTQAATQSSGQSATSTASLDPEIIYVAPAPTPAVITVTHTAPPAGNVPPPVNAAATPPVIHVVVTAPPGTDDGSGGGDD
jgi:hypothetical protein